jgi:murein tripeptide amidase MpaA
MPLNQYFTNEQIESLLHQWQQTYPNLVQLSRLGESYEKRPIWLLTLTNQATGPDTEKPALWIDANIHATEVTGATVALNLAQALLEGFGADAQATRLLDHCAYYIVPRLNPDGAALALAERPRFVRSGVRPYPWQDKAEGLHEEDLDGDGRILQMRIQDPSGDWKVSELDPRLMQKRQPHEHGGVYYRLYPEGRILDFDGFTIKVAPKPEGLDFNRNFPFEWRVEGEQQGAGPYPASESEIRAVVDFISRHPNINIAITYHTFSRVILRCYSTKPDDEMETADLWVYKKIGEIGSQMTGYRCVSTYHDFKYHPKEVTTGAFDDWIYDHLGAFAFTIELWDLPDAAGIKERKFIEWFRNHSHEDDLTILKFIDQHGGADAYIPWHPFDHPQLGKVELGGWNRMYTWSNPPLDLLQAEVERNIPFALALGDLLPRLAIHELQAQPLGDGKYHLELRVENTGFLPTYTSVQGKNRKASRPVRAELELPDDVAILDGRRKVELGHLEGRSNKLDVATIWVDDDTDNRARAEWTLRGQPGAMVTIHVYSDRAGSLHQQVELP